MLWPIKVAGKTMPLLDITKYRNFVEPHSCCTLEGEMLPVVGHALSKIKDSHVTVRRTTKHMNSGSYLGFCETTKIYKYRLLESLEVYLQAGRYRLSLLSPSVRYTHYAVLTIHTKEETIARKQVLPGNEWLDLQDSCDVILAETLMTEGITYPVLGELELAFTKLKDSIEDAHQVQPIIPEHKSCILRD